MFAAFACCLVACQTRLEEEFSGITSIYATMEDGTTKTVLSPGQDGVSSVLWSEEDELAVFLDGKSQATPFKLSEGAGTKKAIFKGSGGGSKYVAFYPAKMVSSLSGDNVRITLPVEQQYREGTFANGSFPMLASGNSPDLSFSNMASILRLSLTGKHSVTRVVFKSAQSSIKVCGQATASVSTNKLTVTSNGRDSLVLTTPGVQLSETQPTDFYLVLPPQTYKGGFTVRVYTGERYMDKTIATDFTMERSRMHVADPFVFTPNGSDVFSVSPSHITVPSAFGGTVSVEVRSSYGYEVSVPEWITEGEIKNNGISGKIHTFQVESNDGAVTRFGEIRFTDSKGKQLIVTVSQPHAYLKADVSSLVFPDNGGVRRISISSSFPWTVNSDASWISTDPSNGTGDGVVGVKAETNIDSRARSATLTFSSKDGSITRVISIVQSGNKPDDGNDGDWKEYPFVHQSVAMRFTATWCGWCPRMNKTIKRAQELYPGHIQQIALHGGGSDLQFSKVNDLMNLFGISGFPTGVVDGRMLVENSDIESTAQKMVEIVKETEHTYGTASGVEISSATSDRMASVSVGVYLKKAGNYKITVLLLEDAIINAQTDYEEGDHARYTHDCIARVAMTPVLGEDFSAVLDYSVLRFNYSVSVPTGYNMANMRVLVYIQRAFGSYPKKQNGSFGNYFIDNCATVELGTNLRLALEGGSGPGDENEGITPGGEIDM